MGKKYIIELEEPEMFDERKYYQCSQMPWWAVSENIVENLTPYTEPDMEQVRKKAYEEGLKDGQAVTLANEQNNAFNNGYENGFVAGHLKAEKSGQSFYEDGYQRGLSDAWEAARKIWQSDNHLRIFKVPMRMDCFTKFSASEAIEKIRQYEQSVTAEEVMRQYLYAFCTHSKGCTGCPLHTPNFTCGRGYYFLGNKPVDDEEVRRAYATVLEKMRGEQDGKKGEE